MTAVMYLNGVDLIMIIEKIEIAQLAQNGLYIQNGFMKVFHSYCVYERFQSGFELLK